MSSGTNRVWSLELPVTFLDLCVSLCSSIHSFQNSTGFAVACVAILQASIAETTPVLQRPAMQQETNLFLYFVFPCKSVLKRCSFVKDSDIFEAAIIVSWGILIKIVLKSTQLLAFWGERCTYFLFPKKFNMRQCFTPMLVFKNITK